MSDGSAAPDSRLLTPVVVGPTGVGKTAVACALAGKRRITVISADARQLYRGLNIGTAKPSPEMLARVPHYGLDLLEPGERYSAGRFARDAAEWVAQSRAEGRSPVVVGGTGLYIRALADGLFNEPVLDPERRERLRAWAGVMEAGELVRWAGRLDARFPGGGRQRAARAIEVALLTGRALSWWQREARASGVLRPWYIHLTMPRDLLHRRLAARVDHMLAAGLVDEVRGALAQGIPADAPGLDGIGYREVVAMLEGSLPEPLLRDAILASTRQYAKRQDTWFRHQLRGNVGSGEWDLPVWSLDATEEPRVLAERILEKWPDRPTPHSPLPVS